MKQKSKRVLLISPPFYRLMGSHYNGLSLGLAYIASVLIDNGHEAKIYNADYVDDNDYLDQVQLFEGYEGYKEALNDNEHPIWEEIRQRMSKYTPDYIGINMYTASYKSARNVATIAKKMNHDIKVVVGGIHPSVDPVGTLQSGVYDVAVVGEGEYAFLDLVNGTEIGKIPGIAYKQRNGHIKRNCDRLFIGDLDSVPFPLRDGLINDGGSADLSGIITSRGCPFKCTYCVSPKMWKGKVRYRSVGNVLDELSHMKQYHKIDLVRFQDDTFTSNKKRVLDLCDGIVDRKLDIQWVCDTRVDRLESELLHVMKHSGCIRVKMAVESGSDEILRQVNKGITRQMILKAVSAIKEVGIPLTIYLMIGFPGETNEQVKATIDLAERIGADYNSLSIVAPYYGTEMYRQLEEQGHKLDKEHWEHFFHQSKDMILNTNLDPEVVDEFFDLNNRGKGKRV